LSHRIGFLRDESQKGKGEKKKQIPRGNDRKKSKGKGRSRSLRDDSQKCKGSGNNEYRDPSLRSRMTGIFGGANVELLVGVEVEEEV
jgi:hypothetical protein